MSVDDRQRAELWALEQFALLREEIRFEEQAKRRAFVQGQVCAYLTEGYSRADAARAAGIRPEMVSRWCRQDPVFAAAARAAQDDRRHVRPRQHRRLKMTDSVQASVVSLLRTGISRAGARAARRDARTRPRVVGHPRWGRTRRRGRGGRGGAGAGRGGRRRGRRRTGPVVRRAGAVRERRAAAAEGDVLRRALRCICRRIAPAIGASRR